MLRTTKTTRLLFRPEIVENPRDPGSCVRGYLCWEKKGPGDSWDSWQETKLNSLRKGEGVKVELKTKEVSLLFESLASLYGIHAQHGIVPGTRQYIAASSRLAAVAKLKDEELDAVSVAESRLGSAALGRLLGWAVSLGSDAVEQIAALDPSQLQSLSALANMALYRRVLQEWRMNENNDSEEYWQELLTTHQFLLKSIFAYPIALVKDKAYVGGKTLDNAGGNVVDYLLKNSLTANAVIVEIKTPVTQLMGRDYRSGVVNTSVELTGSVLQALDYRLSFTREFHKLRPDRGALEAVEPPCVVIIGHTRQLDSTAKRKSFELYRRQFVGAQIVTYDEMFRRAEAQFALLLGDSAVSGSNDLSQSRLTSGST